jgi:hypothetical protein
MPIPKNNNFAKVAAVIGVTLMSLWGYNYYSQRNYGTPKTIVGQRANKDSITPPTIESTPVGGKTMSAT